MAEYTSYQLIPSIIGIEKGDVILLTSDITDLFLTCQEHGEHFDPNILLDKFQEAIGTEGTFLVPTYNWGFCQGKTFDYRKTPSKTGALGNAALRRKDFLRTKHPIYSFAVWGKDADDLYAMENVDSFGADSPFAYLEKADAKNVFIGSASMRNSFTYIHYVEQQLRASYRFSKMFRSHYVDQDGKDTEREYGMYVRNLDLDVVCTPDPFVDELYASHAIQSGQVNGVPYEVIRFSDVTPFIKNDILHNRSRKLCRYKGQ
jgi:aminoglycoside 3-N-acetyltransferase